MVGIRELQGIERKRIRINDNYGAARMHLTIKQEGDNASYSTVYRVMKENGYLHKAKRYPNGITKED